MLTVWLGKTKRIERLGLDLAVLVTIVMLVLFMLNSYLLVRLEDTFLWSGSMSCSASPR